MAGTDVKQTGYVTQIIGPVLDVVFPSGKLPKDVPLIKLHDIEREVPYPPTPSV